MENKLWKTYNCLWLGVEYKYNTLGSLDHTLFLEEPTDASSTRLVNFSWFIIIYIIDLSN